MLNFEKFLYKNVGKRIKNIRIDRIQKQDEFSSYLSKDYNISIDRFRLSNIENGKTHVKKNPYLLTATQIEVFSKVIRADPKDLIFGSLDERESSVKLFLLALIVNGEKEDNNEKFIHPFLGIKFKTENIYEVSNAFENFFQISEEELLEKKRLFQFNIKDSEIDLNGIEIDKIGYDIPAYRTLLERIEGYFKEKHPFFTSHKYMDDFEDLTRSFDEEFEYHSNLLIKLLFGELSFTKVFLNKTRNLFDNMEYDLASFPKKKPKSILAIFNNNVGQFGGLAIGSNIFDFKYFISAFDNMWQRNSTLFMKFFEKNLFNIDLLGDGLKNIDNKYFHEILTSEEFTKLLYSILEFERYDIKLMKGHNLYVHQLQKLIIEEEVNFLEGKGDYLHRYVDQLIKIDTEF